VLDEEFDCIKSELPNVDLVIWDDIASTDLSSYDHSQLLTYIDQRVLSEKSNIFTGNLDNPEITKALGIRLASRVWNSSTRIELKGRDKR
jgi:DNA replication protein DnaC